MACAEDKIVAVGGGVRMVKWARPTLGEEMGVPLLLCAVVWTWCYSLACRARARVAGCVCELSRPRTRLIRKGRQTISLAISGLDQTLAFSLGCCCCLVATDTCMDPTRATGKQCRAGPLCHLYG